MPQICIVCSTKCRVFHNSVFFGSCSTNILPIPTAVQSKA